MYQNESNGNKSVFILLLLLYSLLCIKKGKKIQKQKVQKAGLSHRAISYEQHLDGNFEYKNFLIFKVYTVHLLNSRCTEWKRIGLNTRKILITLILNVKFLCPLELEGCVEWPYSLILTNIE